MYIQKKSKKNVKASAAVRRARRAIRASEDEIREEEGGAASVEVDPDASDLLFEAEDVAELLAEVTGEEINVEADENTVVFEIGEDSYTVDAEGTEEILESTKRPLRGKASVRASKRVGRARRARR